MEPAMLPPEGFSVLKPPEVEEERAELVLDAADIGGSSGGAPGGGSGPARDSSASPLPSRPLSRGERLQVFNSAFSSGGKLRLWSSAEAPATGGQDHMGAGSDTAAATLTPTRRTTPRQTFGDKVHRLLRTGSMRDALPSPGRAGGSARSSPVAGCGGSTTGAVVLGGSGPLSSSPCGGGSMAADGTVSAGGTTPSGGPKSASPGRHIKTLWGKLAGSSGIKPRGRAAASADNPSAPNSTTAAALPSPVFDRRASGSGSPTTAAATTTPAAAIARTVSSGTSALASADAEVTLVLTAAAPGTGGPASAAATMCGAASCGDSFYSYSPGGRTLSAASSPYLLPASSYDQTLDLRQAFASVAGAGVLHTPSTVGAAPTDVDTTLALLSASRYASAGEDGASFAAQQGPAAIAGGEPTWLPEAPALEMSGGGDDPTGGAGSRAVQQVAAVPPQSGLSPALAAEDVEVVLQEPLSCAGGDDDKAAPSSPARSASPAPGSPAVANLNDSPLPAGAGGSNGDGHSGALDNSRSPAAASCGPPLPQPGGTSPVCGGGGNEQHGTPHTMEPPSPAAASMPYGLLAAEADSPVLQVPSPAAASTPDALLSMVTTGSPVFEPPSSPTPISTPEVLLAMGAGSGLVPAAVSSPAAASSPEGLALMGSPVLPLLPSPDAASTPDALPADDAADEAAAAALPEPQLPCMELLQPANAPSNVPPSPVGFGGEDAAADEPWLDPGISMAQLPDCVALPPSPPLSPPLSPSQALLPPLRVSQSPDAAAPASPAAALQQADSPTEGGPSPPALAVAQSPTESSSPVVQTDLPSVAPVGSLLTEAIQEEEGEEEKGEEEKQEDSDLEVITLPAPPVIDLAHPRLVATELLPAGLPSAAGSVAPPPAAAFAAARRSIAAAGMAGGGTAGGSGVRDSIPLFVLNPGVLGAAVAGVARERSLLAIEGGLEEDGEDEMVLLPCGPSIAEAAVLAEPGHQEPTLQGAAAGGAFAGATATQPLRASWLLRGGAQRVQVGGGGGFATRLQPVPEVSFVSPSTSQGSIRTGGAGSSASRSLGSPTPASLLNSSGCVGGVSASAIPTAPGTTASPLQPRRLLEGPAASPDVPGGSTCASPERRTLAFLTGGGNAAASPGTTPRLGAAPSDSSAVRVTPVPYGSVLSPGSPSQSSSSDLSPSDGFTALPPSPPLAGSRAAAIAAAVAAAGGAVAAALSPLSSGLSNGSSPGLGGIAASPTLALCCGAPGRGSGMRGAGAGNGAPSQRGPSPTVDFLDGGAVSPSDIYHARLAGTPFVRAAAVDLEAARRAPLLDASPIELREMDTLSFREDLEKVCLNLAAGSPGGSNDTSGDTGDDAALLRTAPAKRTASTPAPTAASAATRALHTAPAAAAVGNTRAAASEGGGAAAGGTGTTSAATGDALLAAQLRVMTQKAAGFERELQKAQMEAEQLREQLATLEFEKTELGQQDEFEREARLFAEEQLAAARHEAAALRQQVTSNQALLIEASAQLQLLQREATETGARHAAEKTDLEGVVASAREERDAAKRQVADQDTRICSLEATTAELRAALALETSRESEAARRLAEQDEEASRLAGALAEARAQTERAVEQVCSANMATEQALARASEAEGRLEEVKKEQAALAAECERRGAAVRNYAALKAKYAQKSDALKEALSRLAAKDAENAELMAMCDSLLAAREAAA